MMEKYWIKAQVLSGLTRLLRTTFVQDLDELGEKINFDFSQLDNKDNKIALTDCIAMLEACAEQLDCTYLGALLGNQQSEDHLGLLSLLGSYASDLEHAVTEVFNNMSLNSTGIDWLLSKEDDYVQMACFFNLKGSQGHMQADLLALQQAYRLFKTLTDNQWEPTRVYLTYPAPANIHSLTPFFGSNIYYNMDFNGFIFEKSALKIKIKPHYHHMIHDILKEYLLLTGKTEYLDRLSKIKLTIRSLLLSNQSCTLKDVAESQNKSTRALQYFLKNKNTTYQVLLADVRFGLAAELLRDSDHNVAKIAVMTGFSESVTFSRAFKKKFGKTPTQFKNSQYT